MSGLLTFTGPHPLNARTSDEVPVLTIITRNAATGRSREITTGHRDRLVIDSERRTGAEHQRSLYSFNSPRLMIVFWISEVPSPISRNGASRMSRSISYSLEYP